ncbi:hypothetical protein K32_24530 [Kaistia sp. 32K]|uniref:hypothetical protein n=1 Tax=Kaistia sp. 32K TaxID=2795690 RepID=UPI0019155253|nr:hypothetical protein [Kaistia sp. 32K]BCP53836.1 hypothetical protein K32_24530 [Kaistia sp. 32K]
MADRSIPFTAPMVRALIAGTKTQTRRLTGVPTIEEVAGFGWHVHNKAGGVMNVDAHNIGKVAAELLPIQPGDRLWVREAWQTTPSLDHLNATQIAAACAEAGWKRPWAPLLFNADGKKRGSAEEWNGEDVGRRRSGRFMPRWASRLTLTVTEVRAERLRDISEADAIAEGVERDSDGWRDYLMPSTQCCVTARASYRTLWEAINGPGAWKANPWVASYTFTVEQRNIDEVSPYGARQE